VSTRSQDEGNQRLQISRYAEAHSIQILEWFVDKAVSGRKVAPMKREGFRDLYETIEAMKQEGNAPEHVVVYELSRVGRSFWEVLEVVKTLEELAPIISTSPREELLQLENKAFRNLFIALLSWVAENESAYLLQRTQEGLEAAKEKKRHSGEIPRGYAMDHTAKDCEGLGHDPRSCKIHGVLRLTEEGRTVLQLLQVNPKLKPRDLKAHVEADNPYQRWALIRNVKKFGDPGTRND
jgi:putative DNA-invertase from lambdoid prophage Rac